MKIFSLLIVDRVKFVDRFYLFKLNFIIWQMREEKIS